MTDWDSWRGAGAAKSAGGQWLCLADGDGVPIMELPSPVSVDVPMQRQVPGEVSAQFVVVGGHPMLRLLAGDFTEQDPEGRLRPRTDGDYMLVLDRDGVRHGFVIAFVTLEGGTNEPTLLTVHGTDLLDLLQTWPCPSNYGSWETAEFSTVTEDAGGKFSVPRRMAGVQLATTADGYVEDMPADAAARLLICQSVRVVNALEGWNDSHIVVEAGEDKAPHVYIKTDDRSIWDTISQPVLDAGVTIKARLWWPGDPPIRSVDGVVNPNYPVAVFTCDYTGG